MNTRTGGRCCCTRRVWTIRSSWSRTRPTSSSGITSWSWRSGPQRHGGIRSAIRRSSPPFTALSTMPSLSSAERGEGDSVFVRAARREPTDYTPVWFMRQAGRILPEYRALRERYGLIEICRQPELCAEVTLQPMRRMPLDAAVLFADIMLPLVGIGVELDLVDDVGPVIRRPIRDAEGVAALRAIEPEQDVPFVLETIKLVKRAIAPSR